MKTDVRQVRAQFFSGRQVVVVAFLVMVLLVCWSSSSYAPTQIDGTRAKMSDAELSDVDAQAFFKIEHFGSENFWTPPVGVPTSTRPSSTAPWTYYDRYYPYNPGSQNTIRLSLAVDLEVHGQIDSGKLGYYGGGWDLEQNYQWLGDRPVSGYGNTGEGDQPLRMYGLYMDFGFDNLANDATRTLNYIEVGSMDVFGNITQAINTINGLVMDEGTGQNNGVMLRQTAAGTRVVKFDHHLLAFVFASKYTYSDHQGDKTTVSGIFQKLPSYRNSADCLRPDGTACP
jgi:hypothetical protein